MLALPALAASLGVDLWSAAVFKLAVEGLLGGRLFLAALLLLRMACSRPASEEPTELFHVAAAARKLLVLPWPRRERLGDAA